VIDEALAPGNLAIIAQSGVFGNILLDGLYEKSLFVSKAVTLGNRMGVNECDVLDYLHNDPDTDLVMMYLEGAADGERLRETLERVTRDKPVLVLKSGRTDEGRAATASHTGSMSGRDELYDALFAQTGTVRAETLEELLVLARVFSTQPLPKGPRLGVVTSSGSLGALATDTAINAGLQIPPLSVETIEKMRAGAPEWMNVKNPLDLGPSGLFTKGLTAMMEEPEVDMVLAIAVIPFAVVRSFKSRGLTPKALFGEIEKVRVRAPKKPLVVCSVGASEFISEVAAVAGPQTPVLASPELSAKSLAALWNYKLCRGKM
jgi:acetyltransferase